jgi:hypothetical protein
MVNAKANDVKFGRKPGSLTPHPQRDPRGRLAGGETQRSVARSYSVPVGRRFSSSQLSAETGAVALKLTSVNGRTTAEEPGSA